MGPSSKLWSTSKLACPVSVSEFAHSLLRTQASHPHHKHAPTIGLAVSGGVDSMALALLCSQIQRIPYPNLRDAIRVEYGQDISDSLLLRDISFQAFVVDHGVRLGSDLEAQAVSQILKAQDIPTQLLKIDWAGLEQPAEVPNFESLARKYRFQALGKACRNLGITTLFLAHHEDDVAETVMMRLADGHRAAGLMGLQPSSAIPECYGMHGVHESGAIDFLEKDRRNALFVSTRPSSLKQPPTLEPLPIEAGGVKVERPLLSFSKERLIATCSEHEMKWFEDATNSDPTVTMRNAIRHMFRSHALPVAISKPALLQLSRDCRAQQVAKREAADSWLRQCSIKFETSTASLLVRFVDLSSMRSWGSVADEKHTTALLLRRIVMLVTPQEHVSLPSLIGAVERLFPECFWTHDLSPPTAFTVAGLYFKLQNLAKMQSDSTPATKGEWLISRQPYPKSKPLPRIDICPRSGESANSLWSQWSLFDGRFWIRILNLTTASLVVRPFCRDDLNIISSTNRDCLVLRKHLKSLASSGLAWTLPVIATKVQDGSEKALGLPTLGLWWDAERLVKWEVRYKKVETDNIMSLESVRTAR